MNFEDPLNPQAFPRAGGNSNGPNCSEWWTAQSGMTLRDYFAAKALQGMLTNGYMPSIVPQHGRIPYDYPAAAYHLADDMLRLRLGEATEESEK